jgi:hypothetical protein
MRIHILIILFSVPIFSDSSIQIAQMIHSKSQILSIQGYEKAFYEESDPELKKKIAIKILFLYKQFGMNNEYIYFYNKNKLEVLKTVYEQVILKTSSDLKMKNAELIKIINLLFSKNSDLNLFRDQLTDLNNQSISLFVFYFLMKIKSYDELIGFVDALPENSLTGHLRLHLISLDSSKNSFEYFLYLDNLEEQQDKDISLNLYLYGLGLRNKGNYNQSARVLSTSYSIRKNEKVKREIAKSLILSSKKEEACKMEQWKQNSNYEIEELLYHFCNHNNEWIDFMKPKLLKVASNENLKLYEKIFN